MSKNKWTEDDVLLAIDPASHSAGLALFTLKDNGFIGSKTLLGGKGEWPERVYKMQMEAYEFLEPYSGNIKIIVSELIPKMADPSVQCVTGAIASCLPFDAKFSRGTFVSPSSWKAWARSQGAIPDVGGKNKDVKGIKAVHDIFGKDFHDFDSDDACDAFLIGLTWLFTKK